ncbi:MAG: cytochrome c oxidase subunit II transmembrane domain-containing protein, partial [Candidatus Limnocylindria bacterium]
MVRPRRHRLRAVSLLALAATLGACTQSPATVEGGRVQGLYDLFLVAAAIVFVVVAGLIGWNIVRYRSRGDPTLPPQIQTHLGLELVWWALPTALVVGLFAASAGVLNTNDARSASAPLHVKVEGSQWQWRFTYLDSGVVLTGLPDAPPQLVLPVDEPIDFELVSDDVIHSFFISAFLFTRPGLVERWATLLISAGVILSLIAVWEFRLQ